MRFGIGGSIQNSIDKDEFGVTEFETNNTIFDVRLGYERQIPFTGRWQAYFGWDVLFGISNLSGKSQGFKSTENSTTLGTGPVVGFQFNINERFRIFTESNLYYKSTNMVSKDSFDNFPESNSEEKGAANTLQFGLPTNIFFCITL